MARGKHEEPRAGVRFQWSKFFTLLVIMIGLVIAQECIYLMYLCIRSGFTSTAAWLTAAVGLAQAIIAAGLAGYLSLSKSDHREGGITFEAAKANDFQMTNITTKTTTHEEGQI